MLWKSITHWMCFCLRQIGFGKKDSMHRRNIRDPDYAAVKDIYPSRAPSSHDGHYSKHTTSSKTVKSKNPYEAPSTTKGEKSHG